MFKPYMQGIKICEDWLKLARDCRKHIRDNNDVVIAMTGFRGTGKTLMAMVSSYLIQNMFTWDNMIMIPSEANVKAGMDKTGAGDVLILDEAIRSAYKMDFMTNAVKFLYQRFQRERKFNRIIFLLQPSFHDFVKGFRDEIINVWIHIYERGDAIAFSRIESRYNIDRWGIEEPKKEISKLMKKGTLFDASQQIEFDLKQPNAIYHIQFPKHQYEQLFVKSGIEKTYLEKSLEANRTAEDMYQPKRDDVAIKRDQAVIRAAQLFNVGLGLSSRTIGEILGYSQTRVGDMMREPFQLSPLTPLTTNARKVQRHLIDQLNLKIQESMIQATDSPSDIEDNSNLSEPMAKVNNLLALNNS